MINMEVVKNNSEIVYAGFQKRFLADILDSIFILIIWFGISFINPIISNMIYKNLLNIPIWLVYFPIMECAIQSTLGKRILKIKVVGADNNSLSFSKSLIRNIGKLITLFIIALIVFLILAVFSLMTFVILLYLAYKIFVSAEVRQLIYNPLEKQSWYDKLVNAKVLGETIDEIQYFVNGERRPYEEFEKAWEINIKR